MITTEKEAREFLRGWFKSYNNRDWVTFFGKYVWDDCVFINGNGVHSGRDKMIEFWEKNIFKTKTETLMEPTSIFIKDNEIAVQIPIKIYFKEDDVYAGVQFKKGDEITLRCADFYKFKNGKICQFTVYRFSPWWLKDWSEKWEKFQKIVKDI